MFRTMCQENDVKLRDYFGQRSSDSACVKEEHFDEVDARYDSNADPELDAKIFVELTFTEEQIKTHEIDPHDEAGENDDNMHPHEVKLDNSTENTDTEPSDRPRCNICKHIFLITFSQHLNQIFQRFRIKYEVKSKIMLEIE